jgi:hypothetical protein
MLHEIAVGIKKQRGGGGILAGSQDKPSLTHLVASVNRIEFLGILIQRGADLETGAGGYGTPHTSQHNSVTPKLFSSFWIKEQMQMFWTPMA